MKTESSMQYHVIYEINLDKDIVNCLQNVMSGILLKLSLATLTDTQFVIFLKSAARNSHK